MAPGSVVSSVEFLPERFHATYADGLTARFRLKVGSMSRDVVVDDGTCAIESEKGDADVIISTSPATWQEIDAGRLSGIEAFADRRLTIRGSIQQALLFEPLFDRPRAGGMRYHVEPVRVGPLKISTLVAGDPQAPPLLMLHGLGATKASLLTIVPAMAERYRVIVVDLPGFGASSKPRGHYDARWFAEHMFAFMDTMKIRSASLIGNSMGGRISQEMGLMEPKRIEAMALLCPATAFSYRPGLGLVRILRPELGVAAGILPRRRVQTVMRGIFARPGRIEEAWFEAATDDFLKTWRSPRARMAFFAALRNIYLDEPYGETGFFTRLAHMKPPTLYIYGAKDTLISPDFGRKISEVLPAADVQVWADCGHAPQLEHPAKTSRALLNFFDSKNASSAAAV